MKLNEPLKTPFFIVAVAASTFSYLVCSPCFSFSLLLGGGLPACLCSCVCAHSQEREFGFVFVCRPQRACLGLRKQTAQGSVNSPVKTPMLLG